MTASKPHTLVVRRCYWPAVHDLLKNSKAHYTIVTRWGDESNAVELALTADLYDLVTRALPEAKAA